MSTITTKDGRQIYYKDWGKGPAMTFSHGWPLNADAWDGQMLFLAQRGFRVVAHDRRGHGRSTQTSVGNDMNGYADDLAAVIEALDLNDATLVGHSPAVGQLRQAIERVAPTNSRVLTDTTMRNGIQISPSLERRVVFSNKRPAKNISRLR